jgi:hypothetical protein
LSCVRASARACVRVCARVCTRVCERVSEREAVRTLLLSAHRPCSALGETKLGERRREGSSPEPPRVRAVGRAAILGVDELGVMSAAGAAAGTGVHALLPRRASGVGVRRRGDGVLGMVAGDAGGGVPRSRAAACGGAAFGPQGCARGAGGGNSGGGGCLAVDVMGALPPRVYFCFFCAEASGALPPSLEILILGISCVTGLSVPAWCRASAS